MVDTNKLMVTVERAIPYSKMTIGEKVVMANQTEREDLLEAVATDKSLKVRRALIDRVREIPDRILGEYLLKDEDEYIREEARKRIISEKLSSNYYGENGINVVLEFICKFFGKDFVLTLDSYESKRKALSALYLYYMKYGCRNKYNNNKLQIFHYIFNHKSVYFRNRETLYLLKGECRSDEPWNTELWGVLEKLANYKYMPEQIDVVLAKKLLSDEIIFNIEALREWQENTMPILLSDDLKYTWINILAKTLYNLGDPLLMNNDRVVGKCNLILNGEGTEVINAAEEALQELYETSVEFTCYTKNMVQFN